MACHIIDILLTVIALSVASPFVMSIVIRSEEPHLHVYHAADNLTMEWSVLADGGGPFVGEGHLLFIKNKVTLFDYDLGNRIPTTVNTLDSGGHIMLIFPHSQRFGIRITKVEPRDGGVYQCSYHNNNTRDQVEGDPLTLFIYGPPNRPNVAPQTPIMLREDAHFLCITESTSIPESLRPAMVYTWYQDDVNLTGQYFPRVTVDGNSLHLKTLRESDRDKAYYCHVQETDSLLEARSESFNITLITFSALTGEDLTDLVPGQSIDVTWRIEGITLDPPRYDHMLVFKQDYHQVAAYDLRMRTWHSNNTRMRFRSPTSGSYGFKLDDVRAEDMGAYSCIYTDEFGTEVASQSLKVVLQGHTLPETTPTTISTTTTLGGSTTSSESEDITPLSNTDNSLEPDKDSLPLVLGASLGAGVGALVLALILLTTILLCRRSKDKKQEAAVQMRNKHTRNSDAYIYGGARVSIYNTLRESLMVPDDVVLAAPAVPERDDTYNQAWEDSRLHASMDMKDESSSKPQPGGVDDKHTLKHESKSKDDMPKATGQTRKFTPQVTSSARVSNDSGNSERNSYDKAKAITPQISGDITPQISDDPGESEYLLPVEKREQKQTHEDHSEPTNNGQNPDSLPRVHCSELEPERKGNVYTNSKSEPPKNDSECYVVMDKKDDGDAYISMDAKKSVDAVDQNDHQEAQYGNVAPGIKSRVEYYNK